MNETEKYQEHKSKKRTFIGLIFIIVGTALIAKKAAILPENISNIIISWQMLLIALGIAKILTKDNYRGFILIAIGSFFMLPKIIDIPFEVKDMFWPAIFVVIGILMLTVQNRHKILMKGQVAESYIDLLTFMGSGKRKFTANNFLGGKITSFFGGSKIDLTGADMQNTHCLLDIFIVFGGSEIIVPRNWDVQIDVTSIFGGFSDKRTFSSDKNTTSTKVLVIKGLTIFGGGEVKNY